MSSVNTGTRAQLLAETYPFSQLSSRARAALVRNLVERRLAAGSVLLREGDAAQSIFLIGSGRVELSASRRPEEFAERGCGELLGELAIVTGTEQQATITALEPTVVYAVHDTTLLALARAEPTFGALLGELALLQDRPRRRAGVSEHPHPPGDGLLLESPEGRHFLLDRRDTAVWRAIDGDRAVADLVGTALREAYRRILEATVAGSAASALPLGAAGAGCTGATGGATGAGGSGDPTEILRLCLRLRAAGFLTGLELRPEWNLGQTRVAVWRRLARYGSLLLRIRGTAPVFRWLYRHGGSLLFAPAVQVALLLLIVAGAVASMSRAATPPTDATALPPRFLWWLEGAGVVSVCLHELGHALATVWCGCQVRSIGVGWFWFGPVAFVDTTDVWKASRRQRVIVSLAGPCVTLLVASTGSLVATFTHGEVAALASIVARLNYLGALFSLNPLLRLDGYYVLADLLDRPNLRENALAWVRCHLWAALARPAALRQAWVEAVYGVAAVAYAAMFTLLLVGIGRLNLERFFTSMLGAPAAGWLALVLVLLIATLALVALVAELAPTPEDSHWLPHGRS